MHGKVIKRVSGACGVLHRTAVPCTSREGQAMIEFVICLVGILIVAAGLLLVADLTRSDTDTLVTATGSAISDAMSLSIAASFSPIEDWEAGRDGMRYTKDDRARMGNFGRIRNRVTSHTAPDGDWSGLRRADGASVQYDDIVKFNDGVLLSSAFRFMRARDEATVETLPVLQSLMGLPPEITVRNEVWMPAVGGLY